MNCPSCNQPMEWNAGSLVCMNPLCSLNVPTETSGTTIVQPNNELIAFKAGMEYAADICCKRHIAENPFNELEGQEALKRQAILTAAQNLTEIPK